MGGKIAIVYLCVIPILLGGLILIARKAMPLFRRVFRKYDNLNNSVQENIKGMRVVKSFVREDFEKEKFNKSAIDVCKDFTKADKLSATKVRDNVAAYERKLLETWEEMPPYFVTSSEKGTGRDEVLGYIEQINKELHNS